MSENTESMLFTVARVDGQRMVIVRFKHKGKLYGTQVPVDDFSEDTLREALGLLLGTAIDMMEVLDEKADESADDPAGG